ncbi:ankyrin repeat domain-containing protein [bacterium]|nr:ankyrin repeat domain-containing protein [bacterium]
MTADTAKIADTWFGSLDRGDLVTAFACLADDVEWVNLPPVPGLSAVIPWIGTAHGVEEVKASFRARDAVARVELFKPLAVVAQGDQVFGTIRDRSVVLDTNTPFEIEFATWMQVKDGKIVRWRSYCDPTPVVAAFRVGLPGRLVAAVERHDAAAVADLLRAGAAPDTRDPQTGLTVLMMAACRAQPAVVKALLDAGADVFTADPVTGMTALHKACQGGSQEVARLLLDHGSFVDATTPTTGHTPIMEALWYKQPELVQLLLDRGADLKVDTHYGFTLQDHLRFESNVNALGKDTMETITRAIAARERSVGVTIARQRVMAAAKAGDAEGVAELIARGEDVNAVHPNNNTFENGHTPLLVAARDNHPDVVERLLAAGADVRVVDWVFKGSPIHKATYNGNAGILRMILANPRVDIDVQGPINGYTPIHDAIWHGYTECAEILLDAGARLDLVGHDGKTPLDLATEVYGPNDPFTVKVRTAAVRPRA